MNTKSKDKPKEAIQEAIEYGIDVTLLYERPLSTPTERLERHFLLSIHTCEERKRIYCFPLLQKH